MPDLKKNHLQHATILQLKFKN